MLLRWKTILSKKIDVNIKKNNQSNHGIQATRIFHVICVTLEAVKSFLVCHKFLLVCQHLANPMAGSEFTNHLPVAAASHLLMLAVRNDEELQRAVSEFPTTTDIVGPPVEEVREDVIFNALRSSGSLAIVTGWTEEEILSIYYLLHPHIVTIRTPGSRPKSSYLDMLLCYLMWARLATDYAVLATAIGNITASRVEDNINRIRPLLRAALSEKWFGSPLRPTPLHDSPFPHCALIVDGHTTACFRPKARFQDAKTYWDGKNKMYGLKSEVAVRATAPHYCVAVSPHEPASKHDYELHKSNFHRYLDYLLKMPDESSLLPSDAGSRHWAILCDLGYIGPPHHTPDVRRVHPVKAPRSYADRQFNEVVGRHRVWVECFFGRLTCKFKILRDVYRWSHLHFDDDFLICCLLVNESMEHEGLRQDENHVYKGIQAERIRIFEENQRKRKAQQDAYRSRKRARLNSGDI